MCSVHLHLLILFYVFVIFHLSFRFSCQSLKVDLHMNLESCSTLAARADCHGMVPCSDKVCILLICSFRQSKSLLLPHCFFYSFQVPLILLCHPVSLIFFSNPQTNTRFIIVMTLFVLLVCEVIIKAFITFPSRQQVLLLMP